MTEKRFTLCAVSPNVAQIKDKGEIIMIGEVVDLLNKLSEENEELKKILMKNNNYSPLKCFVEIVDDEIIIIDGLKFKRVIND